MDSNFIKIADGSAGIFLHALVDTSSLLGGEEKKDMGMIIDRTIESKERSSITATRLDEKKVYIFALDMAKTNDKLGELIDTSFDKKTGEDLKKDLGYLVKLVVQRYLSFLRSHPEFVERLKKGRAANDVKPILGVTVDITTFG